MADPPSPAYVVYGCTLRVKISRSDMICFHFAFNLPFLSFKFLPFFRYPASSYCYIPHAPHSSKCGGGQSRPLADLSQGSCENTPATPDSLDSLVGSDEDSAVSSPLQKSSCSSDRLQCTSSVLSPLSDDLERPPRASSSNR